MHEIIGTRPNSGFRVPDWYFERKRRFKPGIDPTTGGPVRVVEENTDDEAIGPNGRRMVVSRIDGRVSELPPPDAP